MMINVAYNLCKTARAHLESAETFTRKLQSKSMRAVKIDADVELSQKIADHLFVIMEVDAMDNDALCAMVQKSHDIVAECKAHETLCAQAYAEEIRARRAL